jgi:hypothetical protein
LSKLFIVVLLKWIAVTAADGREIDLNPLDIVSLRVEADADGAFHSVVSCIIRTVDGSYFGVKEQCSKIREMIDKAG